MGSENVEFETGQRWRVAETNRVFAGRVGTVVSIEQLNFLDQDPRYPERLTSEDVFSRDQVRLGLEIDMSGWPFAGKHIPYFTLNELTRVHGDLPN